MKKLFGRDKPKLAKPVPGSKDSGVTSGALTAPPEDGGFYAQQHHPQDRNSLRVSSDEHWDIVSHEAASPVLSSFVPRSASPFGMAPTVPPKSVTTKERDRDTQMPRKKPPSTPNTAAAVGILRALDPHADVHSLHREHSDDNTTELSSREEKRERKGFWERALERDKDKERDREKDKHREKERKDEDAQAELTRMIGYLTATASEDWSLVLEVCERASSSEASAKEAMKALRREFKYAEPSAQLSAARLWAIMLRNCSEVFISQCSSRKFLDTLEDVLQSSRTSPVVRERLMEVLAGAAYSNPSTGKDTHGFRGLWRKVKSPEKPDEGIPFDTEDAMFNPPVAAFQQPATTEPNPPAAPKRPSNKHKSSSRNRVIPPEEDIRRLFQECSVGRGNANLLSDSLAFAKPEDLERKPLIKEFYTRCLNSQEIIYVQIPWASAGAERSRQLSHRPPRQKRTRSSDPNQPQIVLPPGQTDPTESTIEEQLLASLLVANEELTAALRQYEDLKRVGEERETQERSKKETRMDRNQMYYDVDGPVHLEPPHLSYGGATSSHTPSPSSTPSQSPAPSVMVTVHPSLTHPLPTLPLPPSSISTNSHHHSIPSLAPPPPAPHGPRLPSHAVARSRTPSPDRSSLATSMTNSHQIHRGFSPEIGLHQSVSKLRVNDEESPDYSEEEYPVPIKPSAKALGKRRVINTEENDSIFDPDEMFYEHANESRRSVDLLSDDSEENQQRPVHYVYDAAAERMQQRLKEIPPPTPFTGVVH